MAFADNLRTLPSIAHIAAIELLNDAGDVVATIPNQPGKAGSVTVYAALAAKHGSINAAAAQEGLVLFAEHTDDARKNPGNHPNIDRLLEVIESGKGYAVKTIAA
ncbi:DUF2322 family protein [Ottowia thiooxydans]|uniref:DUF2322 family protein n=1 Tax=Ottowia thiooxydans TaxID=219182 RepID=UPI000417C790|nr:DUF2322 family protein [Ottowia thiooxydans]